jgi:calcineurin-like phosphoesterase family protein
MSASYSYEKKTMYWFSADEHYGHHNIIKYCHRPFSSVGEMNEALINNHNEYVRDCDIVIHAGDFTLNDKNYAASIIKRLKGKKHIFLRGSHDRWLGKTTPQIFVGKMEGVVVVICHYAMRTWPKQHYGSIQLHGHSHGKLTPLTNQWDVGVDNNNYYPVSLTKLTTTLIVPDMQIL